MRKGDALKIHKIFTVAIIAFIPTICWPVMAQVTAPNDHLIVPGERVGPFVLGMTEDDLQKLGRPSTRGIYSGRLTAAGKQWDSVSYCYYQEAVCAFVTGRPATVVDIWVGASGDCKGYHTTDSIGCAATAQQAETSLLWGEPISPYINTFGSEDVKGHIMILYYRNANAFTKLEFVPEFWSEASPISDTVQWIDIVNADYDQFHKRGD